MNRKSIISMALAATMIAGCSSANGTSATGSDSKGRVYYLNFKPEADEYWQDLAKEYTEETGVPVTVLTAASGEYEKTLKSEMAKSEAPTLFQVNGPVGLANWKDYCMDLSGSELYSHLTSDDFVLKDGNAVQGIAYVIETYGIIYNKTILNDYCTMDNAVISSVDEINNFATLKAVADDIQSRLDEINEKFGYDLQGAFTSAGMDGSSDWRFKTHLANLPIYYEYKDNKVSDMDKIEFKYAENYKNILDLYMDNSVSEKGLLGSVDVATSMAEFALGQCAMVQNGNWAWSQISEVDGNTVKAEDIKFMPIYFGVDDENEGLCTGTENFWCINSQASKEDIQATKDFLTWLTTDSEGKAYMYKSTDDGGLGNAAPFTTFGEDERSSDPLAAEMYKWMESGKTSVSWNFTTFPSQTFKDDFGAALLEYANGNMSFDKVEKQVVDEWASEKGAN